MAEEIFTQDADGLSGADEKPFKLPSRRIKDYKAGFDVFSSLRKLDEGARIDRINEQALVDGEPPFLQADLDDAGQSYRTNVNWGGAAAKSEQNKTPYHTLLNGVTVELKDDVVDSQKEHWRSIIADGFEMLYKRFWPGFLPQYNNLVRITCDFGVAVADTDHPEDFTFRVGGMGEHLFQRPMEPYEDAAKIHVTVRDYTQDELLAWLNHPKAKEAGFNKEAIQDALVACNEGKNWNDLEDQYSNNWYGAAFSNSRAVVSLFKLRVVELIKDGPKVSESIGRADGQGKDFIYKSPKPMWKDSFRDVLTIFTAGIGNGYLNSIRGLLNKIFDTSQAENIAFCQAVDSNNLRSTVFIKPKDANAIQALQAGIVNIGGGICVFPRDAEFVETQFSPLGDSAIPMLNLLAGHREATTGLYSPSQTPSTVEQTREEVVQRTMQQGVLTADAINWFYSALDRLFNMMMRRILNPKYSKNSPNYAIRQKFLDYCTSRGVPEKVLMGVQWVTATRAVGGGSAGVKLLLMEKFYNMLAPRLDQPGQQVALQTFGDILVGSDVMKTMLPALNIVRITSAQEFAMAEDRDMEQGQPVPVLQSQDHFQHAEVHNNSFPEVGKKVLQPGAPPQQGMLTEEQYVGYLNVFIQHQTQHLSFLQSDPRKKQVSEWNRVLNVARQNQQHLVAKAQAEQVRLQNQAQAQQGREGADPNAAIQSDLAAKAAKTQAEVQAINAKTEAQAQGIATIAQTKAQIDAAKAAQKQAHREADAQQKAQAKAAQTQQDMQIKDAQSASQIVNKAKESHV